MTVTVTVTVDSPTTAVVLANPGDRIPPPCSLRPWEMDAKWGVVVLRLPSVVAWLTPPTLWAPQKVNARLTHPAGCGQENLGLGLGFLLKAT